MQTLNTLITQLKQITEENTISPEYLGGIFERIASILSKKQGIAIIASATTIDASTVQGTCSSLEVGQEGAELYWHPGQGAFVLGVPGASGTVYNTCWQNHDQYGTIAGGKVLPTEGQLYEINGVRYIGSGGTLVEADDYEGETEFDRLEQSLIALQSKVNLHTINLENVDIHLDELADQVFYSRNLAEDCFFARMIPADEIPDNFAGDNKKYDIIDDLYQSGGGMIVYREDTKRFYYMVESGENAGCHARFAGQKKFGVVGTDEDPGIKPAEGRLYVCMEGPLLLTFYANGTEKDKLDLSALIENYIPEPLSEQQIDTLAQGFGLTV